MTLVEINLDTAEKFFEKGGVIHIHPQGYGMHAGHTIDNTNFRSVRHGLVVWKESMTGKPIMLVDVDDPHPDTPIRRDKDNNNKFIYVY